MNRWAGNPWAVLVALCAGFFMTLLDTTVVGVAIPNIVATLGISYSTVLWVGNAYVLALAVALIPGGTLGDLLGKRAVYLAGVAVFTIASLACALSRTAAELIIARAIQGIGAALLVPQTMSIIVAVFPPARRGTALGVWGAVAGVATIAGPPLGGILVSGPGWRWIFTVNVPLGALVLMAAPLIIPPAPRPARSRRFDTRGTILLTSGLFCLAFAVQEGQRYHWGTIRGPLGIPELLAGGAILLAAFLAGQRKPGDRAPIVPTALLRNRDLVLMGTAAIALSVGIMSMALGFQLYAQSVLGFSALAAGLTSAPMSVISVVLGPYAGRFSDRIGGTRLVVAGLAVFAAGLLLFTVTTDVHSTVWTLLPSMVVIGIGLGATFAPLTTVAMREVAPRMAGSASGVLTATRQLGAVLGTAGFGVLLQNRLAADLGTRAKTASEALPQPVRGDFVAGLRRGVSNGLDYAGLQSGSVVSLPHDTSAALAAQVTTTARQVFGTGFVAAMHTAMTLPILAVIAGAAGAAFTGRRTTAAPHRPAPAGAEVSEDRTPRIGGRESGPAAGGASTL